MSGFSRTLSYNPDVPTHVPGTRLGPYEILSSLGEGGMGDVYRARDTRLDRIVALKISKEEFTPRFETEARATAALEHQHICRLYDVCHEGAVSFLVMEYVEGTPLAGPLPLEQALTYARQIAGALAEAHRRQIVHRDLKPSNILVTKGGVKLVDFGLAKLGRDDAPLDDAALTRGITAAGTILGTLHYMSPEQLQGQSADARADIFAFGLVLYEMLMGKRAFEGASAASVIAAILERPAPSVSQVAPASLDRLLQRCLAKDPDERWQSARDIGAALDLITEPPVPSTTSKEQPVRKVAWWPWLVTAASLVTLAVLAFVHFREAPAEPTVVRFQIPTPEGTRIAAPVLSPDGRLVAFGALAKDGGSAIWVRRLDTLETRLLPGTENTTENPFWSPDSRFLAFSADRRLKVVGVADGGVRTVCELPAGMGGGSWSADGVIVFSAFQRGLFRVAASGGAPTQLRTLSKEDALHVSPAFFPDGRRFFYLVIHKDRSSTIHVATLDGSDRVPFTRDLGSRVFYVAPRGRGESGHVIFNRGETLMAQAVDDATLAPAAEPVQIVDNLGENAASGTGPGSFSVSSSALAYLSGDVGHPTQLTWFDRHGRALGVVPPDGVYNDLSLSPDETRLAVTRRDGPNEDIWIVDLLRNVPTRFTFDAAQDWHSAWSPDGSRLAFSSTRLLGGRTNSVFWKATTNIGGEELVAGGNTNQRLDDWSPDGKYLLINRTEGRDDLWILPAEANAGGERKAEPYLQSPFTETRGQFFPVKDPDGPYWIAYTSNESGQNEIYVESYPRGAPKVGISTNGGMQPRWRRDGKELFYISQDRQLMAVQVTRGKQLAFGTPTALFQTRMSLGGTLFFRMLRYDATRDGQRFLINSERESTEASSSTVTVVLNWASLLKK